MRWAETRWRSPAPIPAAPRSEGFPAPPRIHVVLGSTTRYHPSFQTSLSPALAEVKVREDTEFSREVFPGRTVDPHRRQRCQVCQFILTASRASGPKSGKDPSLGISTDSSSPSAASNSRRRKDESAHRYRQEIPFHQRLSFRQACMRPWLSAREPAQFTRSKRSKPTGELPGPCCPRKTGLRTKGLGRRRALPPCGGQRIDLSEQGRCLQAQAFSRDSRNSLLRRQLWLPKSRRQHPIAQPPRQYVGLPAGAGSRGLEAIQCAIK